MDILTPEGTCTDNLLSRKPGSLLSAMHSRAFHWVSAAPLVFLFLVSFPYRKNRFGGFCVFCRRKKLGGGGGGASFVCLQKLYLTDMFNIFFAMFNFDEM
jgi:hypothetical protein